jgi:hypothetical protein
MYFFFLRQIFTFHPLICALITLPIAYAGQGALAHLDRLSFTALKYVTPECDLNVITTAEQEPRSQTMRCYFNLLSASDIIRDTDGIEVDDLEEARAQALRAVEELREDNNVTNDDWQGWRLEVVDENGTLLFAISLGRTFIH